MAVIVAVVRAETAVVLIGKVTVVAPAVTEIFAGIRTAVESLESVSDVPAGAGALSVAVPVASEPPATVAGEMARLMIEGGLMDSVELIAVPLAVIAAEVSAATGTVFTVNVPETFPAAMTQLVTIAAGLLLARVIVIPPVGAAPVSVIFPVDVVPP